jgi:putative DNA modification/repair radical SAM protein
MEGTPMNVENKLRILADAAKYDSSCASSGSQRKRPDGGLGNSSSGICHSYTPDGRCVSLLKILLTNFCTYDCMYCVNRISSDTPRARFSVDEVVQLTLDFYKRNYIEGLFLSSGIIQNAEYTMEQLAAVARKLRIDHKFGGYIHLKGIPGVSKELLIEAGRYADRLSVNIELPHQNDLDLLAPAKTHRSIEKSMDQVRSGKEEFGAGFLPAGQSTQMIVGATPRNDAHILAKAADLYRAQRLKRVYYSAFSPIPHAHSELPVQAPPMVRENRLYQADWLMRFYGFSAGEITAETDGNLELGMDPKLAWALRHREFFPVDVNVAPRETLLRVPGFGVRNVNRILSIRRFHRLNLNDLAKLRIPVHRSRPFIDVAGAEPQIIDSLSLPTRFQGRAEQLSLFTAPAEARTGQF